MIIFGHRGAPGFPRYAENTIGSFTKAIQAGATGLEFDVRRCADGQLAVIHDDTIDRTTNGRGRVADLSYEQLRKFKTENGEAVPLLSSVLEEFGGRCVLNIELKDRAIGPAVKELVLRKRLERQVLVSCFDWEELRPLRPEVPIALLTSRLPELIWRAVELRAAAIHPRHDLVTRSLIEAARETGLRLHAWTVNEPQDWLRLRELGVDGIVTDFPERCTTLAS